MSYEPGKDYLGLTADEYNALRSFEGFEDFNFTPVANGAFYIFNGEYTEFYDFLEDNDLDGIYGFEYFVYMYSTWSMAPGI